MPAPAFGPIKRSGLRYPIDGEKIGPAWQIMWSHLGRLPVGQTESADELASLVDDLVQRRTALSLLSQAARRNGHGVVQEPFGPNRHPHLRRVYYTVQGRQGRKVAYARWDRNSGTF